MRLTLRSRDSREARAVRAFQVVGRGRTQKWSLGRGMTQKWSHRRGRQQPTGVHGGRCGIPFGDTLRPPRLRALGSVGAARAVMVRRMVKALNRCGLMWRRQCHWRCRAGSAVVSGASRTSRRRLAASSTTAVLSAASVRRLVRQVDRQQSALPTAACRASRLREVGIAVSATEGQLWRPRVGSPDSSICQVATTQDGARMSLGIWTNQMIRPAWTRLTA